VDIMAVNIEKRFLTKKELAQYLGISIYTIDQWVSQRREIPFNKAGRRVLFDMKEVEKWIEENKNHPVDL
jgi:excisionase family DNA binding protein